MEFDPAGGYGLGTFTVQIDETSKVFYFGEGKIEKGADIDLFGMWNGKIPAEERDHDGVPGRRDQYHQRPARPLLQ